MHSNQRSCCFNVYKLKANNLKFAKGKVLYIAQHGFPCNSLSGPLSVSVGQYESQREDRDPLMLPRLQ